MAFCLGVACQGILSGSRTHAGQAQGAALTMAHAVSLAALGVQCGRGGAAAGF